MSLEPPQPPWTDAPTIRLAHLRHESAARSLGLLCYLVAFFSLLGTLEFALFAKGVLIQPPELRSFASPELIRILFWAFTFGFLLNTIGQVALGYGLTHLQAWARWTVVALTALSLASHSGMCLAACVVYPGWGLLSFVIGLVIHGLILYPLVRPGSGVIFSAFYREVVLQTPTIKARMHWLLKLLIGLILAGVFGFATFLGAIYFRIID